jgi:alpha-galactosidase
MLEVGNGMSYAEDKAHFTMWCMLSAPLVAGNDLRKMSDQTKGILTNKDVVSIDQDAMGVAAFRASGENGLEIWIKPLSGGKWAVCFLNRSDKPQAISYDWAKNVVKDALSKQEADFSKTTYKLHDVWTNKDTGSTKKAFKATVPAHDVVLLTLTK